MSSMNSSLRTADRATHVRIVVVALITSIAVMLVGLGASVSAFDATAAAKARIDGPAQATGAPVVYSSSETSAIR